MWCALRLAFAALGTVVVHADQSQFSSGFGGISFMICEMFTTDHFEYLCKVNAPVGKRMFESYNPQPPSVRDSNHASDFDSMLNII